jgi:hypothetical protein
MLLVVDAKESQRKKSRNFVGRVHGPGCTRARSLKNTRDRLGSDRAQPGKRDQPPVW